MDDVPLVPARMLNEFVYCPRLGYMMWVQGEFVHSADTIDGVIKHRKVDMTGGKALPEPSEETIEIHSHSVSLSSNELHLTAKIDLVEGQGQTATPVDYKRGKRPHIAGGVYDPERIQLCAQALLLREHGYECEKGIIYFVSSKERVPVPIDRDLEDRTRQAIDGFIKTASEGKMPPPLEDSPKCPRCSLVGICLPDETTFLNRSEVEPRPIVTGIEGGLPLYIQTPRAYIRKRGEELIIEVEKEKVATTRLADTTQVVLFGGASLTTPALLECMRRDIPVTWLSYGGWFIGHTVGTGHKNVETRTVQYRSSFNRVCCLRLAKKLVAAKIANCRTLLKRNWKREPEKIEATLTAMRDDIRSAMRVDSIESLLGVEGNSASRYFGLFEGMLRLEEAKDFGFSFTKRNRRPPRDPVNAMLSFAYAMLVREWTVTLSAVGLDPYRGFYHQPRYGRPALSLDMMEPFRPLICDSTVITAINNGEVKKSDFIMAVGGCNLIDSARKKFIAAFERRMNHEITHPIFKYRLSYRRLLEVQARLLIRYLAGEIPSYPSVVTR
ncbi:CRISPR-associated protein Cas4/endonuclease Cas1 fusion [uncultured Desulfatiglans sp.]|uniref:CRISPR-associated endonuclease Cas1 n=1 Tax=Uncultured Desulfatiglans sp. TaxID=1748965 RepID=A0A653ACV6_UNCDX|nr:CRISPR-associated protein Cas4/endonuclease Cas1 fusion [uncultured Desulfatiglans sp.]